MIGMIALARKLLHSVYCWWVVKTVQKYYKRKSIAVVGELEKAILEKNCKALRWVSYSVRKLNGSTGMPELLEQLASINGVGSERRFNNLLTELHAACFLSKVLGEMVLEVESRTHQIRSPYGRQSKSCDIRTTTSVGELYYEVKDASSEITTSYQENGVTHFEPMDDDRIEQWIKDQTKEADICGAQYLICRVPVWLEDASKTEELYGIWIERVFKRRFRVRRRLSGYGIAVHPNFSLSAHIKGIYLLKAFGYIELLFQPEQEQDRVG